MPPAAGAAAVVAAGLALVGAFATIGGPEGQAGARILAVADVLVRACVPVGVYLLGAMGLGRLLIPLYRGARDPWAIQAGLGLALMLTISHGLGALGLMNRATATAVCVLGMVLLAVQLVRERGEARSRPVAWTWLLAVPAGALLLTAACQPPGWLWASEGGGYDVLEYHLQLPQEWLALDRLRPLEHNVYSYLPGYFEAAYLHLGALLGAPGPTAPGRPFGLLAGDGLGVLACQILHAGMALGAAWVLARACTGACRRAGIEERAGRIAGAVAGAIFLCTPWTIVTGSLAYNEMAMMALGAAALLAALDDGLTPARRGLAAGLLVGAACGCKPTALLLIGPPVGIALLAMARPRDWALLIGAGAAAGMVMLAPWLIRNAAYGGNPVFPHLASVFGSAHWSPEQIERYTRGHSYDGTWGERLGLLVAAEPAAPDDPPAMLSRHRGLMHPQWFVFFPLVAWAGAAALARPGLRRMTLVLVAGLAAQLGAWLVATHLQSRFLLPLAIPGSALVALWFGAWSSRPQGEKGPMPGVRVAWGIALAAVLNQAGASLGRFASERKGEPNALLVPGPGLLSGSLFESAPAAARAGIETPEAMLNLLPPAGGVYLLGDATPLYFAVPALYHTTWDRSPLGEAIRSAPDDPAAWTAALRSAGVRLVLVSFAELDRLHRSGWYDPAVTPEAVREWLRAEGRVVHSWPQTGRVLADFVKEAR